MGSAFHSYNLFTCFEDLSIVTLEAAHSKLNWCICLRCLPLRSSKRFLNSSKNLKMQIVSSHNKNVVDIHPSISLQIKKNGRTHHKLLQDTHHEKYFKIWTQSINTVRIFNWKSLENARGIYRTYESHNYVDCSNGLLIRTRALTLSIWLRESIIIRFFFLRKR